MLYYTILYYTILYYTTLYIKIWCNTIQYNWWRWLHRCQVTEFNLQYSFSLCLSFSLSDSYFLFLFSISSFCQSFLFLPICSCNYYFLFHENSFLFYCSWNRILRKSTYITFYSDKLFRYSSRHNFTCTMNVLRRTYVLRDHIFFCNVSPGIFLAS